MKCCPKLHIKQLRNIYITFVCEIGLGGRGGSQMKRGGSRKRGGSGPPDPPSGHAYVICTSIKYKVERDERYRYLAYIELGHWLCSHFQLETPLNFHKPITQKLYSLEK